MISDFIEHGHDMATPLLLDEDMNERRDELDNGVLHFVAKDKNAFRVGVNVPVTGFGGLHITDLRRVPDGPNWEFWLQVKGVYAARAARRKDGFPLISHQYLDWDRVEDEWITTNRGQIVEGQFGLFGGTTVCTSVQERPLLTSGWYALRASFVGIVRTKPRQRTVTVNGMQVDCENVVVPMQGGWFTPRHGVISLAKIVCTDRYWTTSPPPTGLIPGPLTPVDPPQIKQFTLKGTPMKYYWPGGWHLAALRSERLGDKSLHQTDYVYEYQWQALPDT